MNKTTCGPKGLSPSVAAQLGKLACLLGFDAENLRVISV